MKILSGKYKRYDIKTSKNISYRPTKTIVRKSIFDKFSVFNKKVLDLFSGTGIIGFEAMSRGANSITFVEKDQRTIRLIKKNAEKIKGPNYAFFQTNVFDFIFADPPYDQYDLKKLSKIVLEILKPKGVFILECKKNVNPFFNALYIDYGYTRVLFWEKKWEKLFILELSILFIMVI